MNIPYIILIFFILPLFFAGLLSYLINPLVIKLMWKLGLVDDPAKNHHPKVIHKIPTPRGGGLAIFMALSLSSLIFLPIDKHLIAILLGASVLVIMGILDDKYDLNPYLRLIVQFTAALFPIASGIGISFISNPIAPGVIDISQPQISFLFLGETRSILIIPDLFALLWIVVLMNFMNMGAKGVPGQLNGVTAIAATAIGVLSLRYSADITQWPVIILAAITAGAFIGALPWNMFPQRIMPSFSGSNVAGYILAILSILSTTKVGTLMVVLSIPLIDTAYTISRRILAKKSPVRGDRGHLHHKLLDKAGLSQRQVAYLYWGITAILGFISLQLNASVKFYTIIAVGALLAGILIWLTYRSK